MYRKPNLGKLKSTSSIILLTIRSIKTLKGIINDVFVQVDKFIYLVDFVVLETKPFANKCKNIPIIEYWRMHIYTWQNCHFMLQVSLTFPLLRV